MLCCGALQRSNNTYVESIICFSELEKDPRYVGRKSRKRAEAMEKSTMGWKQNLCVCVCVCVCVLCVCVLCVCVCVLCVLCVQDF